MRSVFDNDRVLGWALVTPLLIWIGLTLLYPLIFTVQLSFTNLRYVGGVFNYVGLRTYSAVLTDPEFTLAVVRTIIWSLANVVLQIVGSLIVALVLNQNIRGKEFIRNWIVIPWVLPTVVLTIIWTWILDPTLGVLNYLLRTTGLAARPIKFLSSPKYVMPTVIAINVWRWVPYFSVIVLAALQSIPRELYEAAEVDGATTLKKLVFITLPSIRPVLLVLTLFCLLWSSNIFDTIWLLTAGGPVSCTTTLPIYIYREAFQYFRFAKGAVASVLFFMALLGITVLYIVSIRKKVGGLG